MDGRKPNRQACFSSSSFSDHVFSNVVPGQVEVGQVDVSLEETFQGSHDGGLFASDLRHSEVIGGKVDGHDSVVLIIVSVMVRKR
jgi:hypothetical protein